MTLPSPPLLVITDRRQGKVPLEQIAVAAFTGGCRWLSVREKDLPAAERLELVCRIAALGADYGAVVGVHDDVEAARAIPGTALHLPARAAVVAGARLVGRSAHAGDDLGAAATAGLDYVTLSPVFASASKPGYGPALGLGGLAAKVCGAAVPVIALGGIRPGSVRDCLYAGAAGVAVMGEVMRAADPTEVIRALIRKFDQIS